MASQPPKTSRTWGKNIASSIAHVTKDIVAEVMPNSVSTISSLASSGKGVIDSLSRSSQSMTRQINVMDRSQSSRKTKGMFKRAMDDIREGNLYYKDTANELSYLSESFDSSEFETPTDSEENFSAAYSATDSVKAITSLNSTMAATSSATISGIGRMADMISGTQLKASEALSATFKNVSIAQSNIISEGLNQVAKQIQINNQYSAAMLEFMNKNISPTNQSMLDVMPLIGQKLDQIASSLSGSGGRTDRGYRSPNDPMNSIFAEGSGLNVSSLMKQVKQNFDNSGVGAFVGMMQMMTGIGTGGGFGNVARTTAKSVTPMITKHLAKTIFGKDNLDRIGSLDETVHNAVKEALYSLGDLKDPNIRARSKTNRLINFFSDILGIERPKLTKLQLGGGRRDENMQWNAIAQKTLVDVIPGFLSSIDKAVNGNQYAKHYDYRSGKFMTEEELGRRYAQEVRKMMDETFDRSTSKLLDSLAGTGIRFSEKDVDKIIGALNSQIDGRINGIEGNTQEYRSEMQSILTSNGMAADKVAEVLSTIEKSINTAVVQMSKFNHDINMGNYDSQAYRNMMAGSTDWGTKFHNYASTRSYSAINKGAYRASFDDPRGLVPAEVAWDIIKGFTTDGRKPANAPHGGGAFVGGMADTLNRAIQNFTINAETTPEQKARYQTKSAIKAADSAHAINKKKEKYSKLSKRNLSNFKTGSLDSQVLAQNIAIEEAYLSDEPTDIMQGLAQDIHNNLLVPMYGTFFSKNGILNKFFGDDPNSEFNKLKEKLFGDNGLFRPMSDWLKYKFTGKGYTAKDGTVYEDTDDNVLNKLKGTYGQVYDNTMIYLLGEDYKDQEIYSNFLQGLSPEGIAQRRAQKRAKKEIIKRDAEKWAEERESRKFADQEIGKGYRNRSSIGYGFSQYDPRWANMSTGRYSDGRIATMATAGCGPVALANVANYLGYGGDPTSTLDIARRSGFLSNGGATEKLFTRGASKIGLNGKAVSFIDAMKSLRKGMPVIFAGKSKGKGSIYSNEGHIITAYRTTEGGVLVNDGDKEYLVTPEALLDGMTHAFSFTGKRGLSIGGALDNDDMGRQFLRDRAKYSEETINMVDYLRAIGIEIGYDELDKRLKKRTRKPADPSKKSSKHVYDDVLLDIKHILEHVQLEVESMNAQYKNNPEYLNNIKQILDKKIPDMNKLFAGLAETFNVGMENLRWAIDSSAFGQRESMDQIQDIIQRITSDQADLIDANVRAAIGSDIKDLTTALTSYMQAMPQQPSYLQKSDYAEARELIGSLTSQIGDIAKNIGDIQKPENLKAIIDIIATMNETQLKSAISTTLDPTRRGIIDPSSLFVDIDGESASNSTFVQKQTEMYESIFSNLPDEDKEKNSAEVKVKEGIQENAEKIEKSMEKQAKSAESAAKSVKEMEDVVDSLSENPNSFKTKFSKGYDKFKQKLAKHSTSHIHTAVLGAGLGLLNGMGGGLLTNLFLPGGPIGGAVLGLAGSIIGHSETVNKILYGETDADGHFHEGLTTKKAMSDLNAKFKKALPYALGGATLGVVKNVVGSLFGLSLGGAPGFIGKALLGTGPMGAAIVGMSIGLLKNSDKVKEMLFGTKEDDGKHYGGKLSGALNKMTDIVKASSGYLKTGIKGAGFGALGGMALSSMGYLPAALAVGGPIGMAVAGLAVGIASNTDRFKRYLFGTESVDEDGNYHKNKDGFLHRAGQAILQDAIYPMKDMMAEKLMDFGIWARKNIELPFKIAFGPLVDKFKDIKKDVVEVVKDTFDKVGKGVLGFFKGGVEKALTPVTWALRKGADLASSAVIGELKLMGRLAMAPVKMLAKHNMKHGAYKQYNKDYRGKIRDNVELKWKAEDEAGVWEGKKFAGIRRGWSHMKDALGFGEFVDPEMAAQARSGYGTGMKMGGQDNLQWFEANAKFNKANAKYITDKERRQKFKKASELARQWSREDKYNESQKWTQELLNERYNQLRELGFDDRAIKSESEIKNLMFHRGEWQSKWGKYGDEDLRVEEVKLQQEAAEKTENYQSTMTDYMAAIVDIMMGAGYQKALDLTHGTRIERSRAQRDKIFTDVMKNGGDIKNFEAEMTMTREEYNAAQKQYANHFKAMENMSYDERVQYVKDNGLPRYVANMIDDSVKSTSSASNILDFGSFMKKTETSSAEVKQSMVKEVVSKIQDEELKTAAASAFGIDLSDETVFTKAKMTKGDIRSTIERLNSGVREKDSSVDITSEDGKGKIDVNKFIDVALQNGLLDQSQADEVRNSFKRSKTVSQKTLNAHLKDVLFEAMDEALDKNLDAYDAEQDREEEQKNEKAKETAQSDRAQALGDKKDAEGEKEIPRHSKLYQKLFYNSDGEERGGILGWFKKKADKVGDSSLFRTMSAILSNPIAQIGLGLGAYFFSDELIGFADKVSDVWQEHIPALWQFVSTNVVPAVIGKVGDIASWCVQALPEIFMGVANGLWTLVKDVGRKLGIGSRDQVFSEDKVNLETGTSIYGDTLVQYTDPETGETTYVTDENGNYMTLGHYQYLSSEGTIENINMGTGYKFAEAAVRAYTDPRTAKRMLNLTGAGIRATSWVGRKIPVVGNVFKVTDAAGKKMMDTAKKVNTNVKLGQAIVKSTDERAARYAFDAYDAHKSAQAAKDALDGTKAVKAGRKAGKYAAKAVTETTDEVASGALKSVDKILGKLAGSKKKFTKLMDESVILKWFDYIGKTVKAALKKAKSAALGELASQIAKKSVKVLDDWIPIIGQAMTAYDAIKGWCDAEYLFDVPSGEETTGMRLISSVMNTLLGLGIGPVIDIILVFASEAAGFDIKKDIAQKLYVFFCELSGNDKELQEYEEKKEVLQAELAAYNAAHPTAELSVDEYQKLKQEANSGLNKVKNVFGGGIKEDFSKYEKLGKELMVIQAEEAGGIYRATQASQTVINQYMITDPNLLETGDNVGNGKGPVGYGLSQSDPRWANYKLGKFANGKTATMDLAGCGPTALANVASQLSGSNVSPVQVASVAKRRGYLTHGGANEALFDNGTEAFGLSSKRIGNSDIVSHLRNGEKVIVSGKSMGIGYGRTPFTPAGHIITLEGIAGNNVMFSDPQDGSTHIQSLSSLTPELTHAWAFSNKGKNHVIGSGIGMLGYGSGSDTSKPYTADQIAQFLRSYQYDPNPNDKYYTGNFHDFSSDPAYSRWMYDRMNNGYGVLHAVSEGDWMFDERMRYDVSKLTESGMYFNQITSEAFNQMDKWYNSLSSSQQADYFKKWATDAAFNSDALRSIKDLQNDGYFYDSAYQYLMDYYYFPKYAMSKNYTAEEIANMQMLRGYAPKMTGYMYDPANPMTPQKITSSAEAENKYKSEVAGTVKMIEDGVSWNGYAVAGMNDINSFVNMTVKQFMDLSDPTVGGDPNVKASWLYRYLYYVFDKAVDGKRISEYDKIGLELIDKAGGSAGRTLAGINGLNIDLNDYTVDSTRPYGIVNGIPYFYQNDGRWSSFEWKGKPFNESGADIASLAMILSAYAGNGATNRAITPQYMMQNWFTAEHPDWWDKEEGFTTDFFSSKGMQTLKETFDMSGAPLRLEKITGSNDALNAMRNNKLVLMTGRMQNGLYNPHAINTMVGTYANDGAFILTDPQIMGKGTEVILPEYMMSKIFKSGIVFSNGNGEGLLPLADRDYSEPEQSQSIWENILESTKDEWLAPIAQFTSGISSIIGNLAKSLFNGKKYESIFDTKYDSDDTGQIEDEDLDNYDYLSSGMTLTTEFDGAMSNLWKGAESALLTTEARIDNFDAVYSAQYGLNNNLLPNGSNLFTPLSVKFNPMGSWEAYKELMSKAASIPEPTFPSAPDQETNDRSTTYSADKNGRITDLSNPTASPVSTPTPTPPIGGEYDIFDKVSAKLDSIFETVFGYKSNSSGTDVDIDIESGNTTIDTSNLTYSGSLTAPGLVEHARKMRKLGARYVWGGSCERFTEKYRNQLYQYCGDRNHNQQYYIEKYNKFANKYVTDCSGLIRGYTKVSYNAHGLYTNSTQSGPISTVPNAPGYLVFRKGSDSDRMVHVGITTGGGKVIHCAKYEGDHSVSDVKEEKIDKSWTHWGKCHLIDYGTVGMGYGTLKTAAFDARVRDLDLIGYGSGSNNPVNYLTKTLGGHITQGVGYGVDPSTGNLIRHRGTDIAAKYGTPIHSPVSGKVVESRSAGYGSAYGNYTVIKDNHGSKHLFAHMDRPTGFGVGSTVHSGDVIGNVGNSGYSTGPHLHYEVRNNDHIIDPLNHKTNLNIIESRFDESMKKTSSPTGGENDIIKLASSLGATASNTDEIVNVLRRIADLLSVWQGTDEESKAAMLEALENSSGANASLLTNLVNNSNAGGNNVSVNSGATSDEDPVSSGGRALFNLIASKE